MDKRIKNINLRLTEYSLGNFNNRVKVSPELDEVDAISSGINMLGEELKAITISRNYFTNIFNSVSDMVFVLNPKGIITDANKSAQEQLKYESGSLIGKPISDLHGRDQSYFKNILKQLKEPFTDNETILHTNKGEIIPVRINVSQFSDQMKNQFILLTATDITFQIKAENMIIRAIIDTQEKERQRLAKDLHDSIIQPLSGIKLHISSSAFLAKSSRLKSNLVTSGDALNGLIIEMRNICFNLMPNTLEEFGLVKAIQAFCSRFLFVKKTKFKIEQNCKLPDFPPEINIDLYRIMQEFINNSIKHGEASSIRISFIYDKKNLKVILSDNGKGFDTKEYRKGMGLQNVKSRVKSHKGTLNIVSSIGKGTRYTIAIPLNIQI